MGRYTHGKSKGTSDRSSSKRFTSPGGATSSIIPEINLKTSIETRPFTAGQTYFKSQPLTIPGPVNIPDAPIAPDVHKNAEALADWAGQINKDIDQTSKSFWNWNVAMDKAARKKAELQVATGQQKEKLVTSQKNLNKAKNILEKDAKTNSASAHSWSVLHGLDRRTEREYDVVVAKNELMSTLQNLPAYMLEQWKLSIIKDDGKGVLRPYSLPNEEDIFSQRAMEYINQSTNNGQALVESKSQIQAAIYTARQQVSTEHNTWLDSRADLTYNKGVSTAIRNSLNDLPSDDLGFIDPKDSTKSTAGKMSTILMNNYVNGSASNKSYQELKKNVLGIWINSAIAVIPAERFEAEIGNIKNELLNSKVGPNTYLWELYGSKEQFLDAFDLAIDSARNNKNDVTVEAAQDLGLQNAQSDFEALLDNHNDFDLNKAGVQDSSKTIVLSNGDTVQLQTTNLEGMKAEVSKLRMQALQNMEPGPYRTAYLQELTTSWNLYMDGYGKSQQEANYEWLYEQISTTKKPLFWLAQVKYFEKKGLITSDKANDLINNPAYGIGEEIRQRRTDFDEGNEEALKGLKLKLEGYYINKGDENVTTTEEQILINQTLTDINNELLKILSDKNIDFATKQKKALELIQKKTDEITLANNELVAEKKGVNPKDKDKQQGSGQTLTINDSGRVDTTDNLDGGATNDYIGTTPHSIVKVLSGKRDKNENLALSNSITRAPLYSKSILKAQLAILEQEALRREELKIVTPTTIKELMTRVKAENFRLFAQRRNAKDKIKRVYDPVTDPDFRNLGKILFKIDEHMTPKEFFINQMKVHGIEMNDDINEMLNNLWPEPEVEGEVEVEVEGDGEGDGDSWKDQGIYNYLRNDGVETASLTEGTLVASTDLTGVLKKESTPPPPPRIDPSQNKKLYPEGIETGSYVLPKDVTDDKEFVSEVEKLSTELKIPVNYLWAVMGFETGGTYDPGQYNLGADGTKESGSGAVGLIQFTPATLKEWGVTTEQAAKMTRLEQMKLVRKHLKRYIKPGDDFRDVYMSILFPAALGKPNDFVLFGKGAMKGYTDTAYEQNKGLDKNGDGSVTKEEAASSIPKYLLAPSVPKKKESSTMGTRSNIA